MADKESAGVSPLAHFVVEKRTRSRSHAESCTVIGAYVSHGISKANVVHLITDS